MDLNRKEIFAMSTERVTRIKHDFYDISPILDAYPELFKDLKYVCYPFLDSNKNNDPYADLSKKNVAEVKYHRAYRKVLKPKYLADLKSGSLKKIAELLPNLFTNPINTINVFWRYFLLRICSDGNSESNLKAVKDLVAGTLESRGIFDAQISFFDHHFCHAIAAYYFSPFDKDTPVLSLTLDGSGDGFFSKVFLINDLGIKEVGSSPNVRLLGGKDKMTSLGEVYARFTSAMDLYVGSDEGKVEALAAFGRRDVFLYEYLMKMTLVDTNGISFDLKLIEKIYDENYLRQERMRVGDKSFCASVQDWLGDTVVSYLNILSCNHPGVDSLALSGGVAANIIMSLNIYERTPFRKIFVLPFMGDEGVSAGACILKALELGHDPIWLKKFNMPYLGDSYSRDFISVVLKEKASFLKIEDLGECWQERAASDIHQNKIISLFNGRMEFGPRALGNRSIVANPTYNKVTDLINSKVKRRPWYQPFCPSILEEERERLFSDSFSHKHMAIAFRLKKQFLNDLPAASHVDGTARPQFVSYDDNPGYWKLLYEFKKLSGYGVLVNTSFNLHGRTIVRTPEDAIRDFIDCGIDVLYMEGFRVSRK